MKRHSSCILLFLYFISVNAEDIHISVDSSSKQFVVTLAANPSTGFLWSVVQYDKNLLNLIHKHYVGSSMGLIGSGGKMNFTFSLKNGKNYPKQTKMKFSYARSWEPSSATMQDVTIEFISDAISTKK